MKGRGGLLARVVNTWEQVLILKLCSKVTIICNRKVNYVSAIAAIVIVWGMATARLATIASLRQRLHLRSLDRAFLGLRFVPLQSLGSCARFPRALMLSCSGANNANFTVRFGHQSSRCLGRLGARRFLAFKMKQQTFSNSAVSG